MTQIDLDVDFFDHEQTQHMWELLRALRARRGVARTRQGFWYTTRYAETRQVFSDYRGFSCAEGHRAPGVDLHPEDALMAETDAPEHLHLRKYMLQVFNQDTAVKAEAFMRGYVRRIFEAARERGGAELVSELSMKIPTSATCHLLGVPEEEFGQVSAWIFDAIHTDWPSHNVKDRRFADRDVGIDGAAPEMSAYFYDQISARRNAASPPDDLLTGMIRAEVDGQHLSDRRIRTLCFNFLGGGLSTTNLVSNLLYRLMTDPELERVLRERPERIAGAVEESLRLEPPVMFLFRTAVDDTELGGVRIGRGERVVMGIASANRDEREFEAPEEFRLDRPDAHKHLAFGAGPHLCLGNTLARMEGRVAVEEFLACFAPGRIGLAPDFRYQLMPHFLEYGPERLDVVVAGG